MGRGSNAWKDRPFPVDELPWHIFPETQSEWRLIITKLYGATMQIANTLAVSKIRKKKYRSDAQVTFELYDHFIGLEVLYSNQNYTY